VPRQKAKTNAMLNHQFALNFLGEWVDARKVAFKRGVKYFCPCPDHHELKHVTPSGDDDKRPFIPYFADIGQAGGTHSGSCRPGGESMEHMSAKQMLCAKAGRYEFVTEQCPGCKAKIVETGKGATVTLEVVSADNLWRYDALMRLINGLLIALEICHTHATGSEKVNSTRRSGIAIAEFRSEDVLAMEAGDMLENLQMRIRFCDGCLVNNALEWIEFCHVEEFDALKHNENVITCGYWDWWWDALWKVPELRSVKIRKAVHLKSLLQASLDWICVCFEEECDSLQHNEKICENGYWSAWAYELYKKQKTDQDIMESGDFNWYAFKCFLERNPIAVQNRMLHFSPRHVRKHMCAPRPLKRKRFVVWGYA